MCGEQEETRRTDDLDVFGFESHAAKLDWAAQGAQKGDDVPLDPVARLGLCRRTLVDAAFLDTFLWEEARRRVRSALSGVGTVREWAAQGGTAAKTTHHV